jgi:hypothetical protein
MKNSFGVVCGLLFISLLSGCLSTGGAQTASLVERGRVRLTYEPPGVSVTVSSTSGKYYFAPWGFSLKAGLAERFELGLRLGHSGVGLQPKVLLTAKDSRWIVSCAPFVEGATLLIAESLNAGVPVYLGYRTTRGHEWVFAPRVQYFSGMFDPVNTGSRAVESYVSVGATMGFAAKVNESLRLMPEVGFLKPVRVLSQSPQRLWSARSDVLDDYVVTSGFAILTKG